MQVLFCDQCGTLIDEDHYSAKIMLSEYDNGVFAVRNAPLYLCSKCTSEMKGFFNHKFTQHELRQKLYNLKFLGNEEGTDD